MSIATNSWNTRGRYEWWRAGDINAVCGLVLDNISDMILMAGLLVAVFGFPEEFVLTRMIPGTAIGVLVGDLIYTFMAFRLARRTGRSDVTAMPLGLDTPSTFGAVFLILGPSFLAAKGRGLDAAAAARHAWFIGIAMLLASGVFKLGCAVVSDWIRRRVPRAGLLGSLVSIALVIISFLPLLDVAAQPIAGFVALLVILATLTARWELPGRIPGAVASVAIGALLCGVVVAIHTFGNRLGWGPLPVSWTEGARPGATLRVALPLPVAAWWTWFEQSWREAAQYLPVAIPLALATVVGGIDCAESAAAAGDDYPTGPIIAAEGFATLVGGLCGGVIQSTPYIGHPAYKSMGARAGYTLVTALFVGAAGVGGFFAWIFFLLPKAIVFPILIFVGIEITAQSFAATPKRHFPALAFACVPALAYLAYLTLDRLFNSAGKPFDQYPPEIQHWIQTITILANGFIVTSLLWGMTLAKLIDGRFRAAAATLAVAGALAWCGIIHSPLRSGPIVPPWEAVRQLRTQGRWAATAGQTPYHWAAAYGCSAIALWVLGRTGKVTVLDDEGVNGIEGGESAPA